MTKTGFSTLLTLAIVLVTAPRVSATEPIYKGLGDFSRKVTTTSPEAQQFFDQGLRFLFGYNHGASIRSFSEAAKLDPGCAMAHWGIALACGPHINLPIVSPASAEKAWRELALAEQYAENASPVERALIAALAKRYANPQPDDRAPLDLAYANAMREVWRAYPNDADVGAFFAESLLDLRPWDQWTPDGKPQPGTEETMSTLEAVLKIDVLHPFANHLYIHTIEGSAHPELANTEADRLLHLQPGLAHNVHMPSHIYIRTGRWFEAIASNQMAVNADRRYREIAGKPVGFLPVYIAHNEHMLAYAAMMTGQRKLAVEHVRAVTASFSEEFLREYGSLAESFYAMPYEVLIRFGSWDEMLAEPELPASMPLSRTLRHAARGIALAAKGDTESARAEQKEFAEASKAVPKDETSGNNDAPGILAIAGPMLDGEILYREGNVEPALVRLREAVAAEDALHYDEPPSWLLPVRHSLGATLVREGRYAEAEKVYREDLAKLPENGWSLYGLADCLSHERRPEEAAAVEKRFQYIWAKADTPIRSSCLCQPSSQGN
jgi:tetratricopeptide (TPR) repeat protein